MDAFITTMDDGLRAQLFELWERTGDDGLRRLAAGESMCPDSDTPRFAELTAQEQSDWIGTRLMNAFKDTSDPHVFALLYELAEPSFRATIAGRMRRCHTRLDAHDVLQEVFLNIYRYPHRFHADRADAFRNWGHTIVRNTLLKMLKGEMRRGVVASLDEETIQQADLHALSPLRSASDAESAGVVDRAYLIYLNLYMLHFAKLSAKEQRALTMVEVIGASYKDTAAEFGIRLENLKMVIFRARRKIMRGMTRMLSEVTARNERREALRVSRNSGRPAVTKTTATKITATKTTVARTTVANGGSRLESFDRTLSRSKPLSLEANS
ncbi:MAG: RNA polymerase sigma factor [Planctomycetota bacterium]